MSAQPIPQESPLSKYKKNQQPTISTQTVDEAETIAKATQRPGQTKEQTKLIAQGIQKGIEEYKKRQKTKARELDKQLKKVRQKPTQGDSDDIDATAADSSDNQSNLVLWILLGLSWVGFVVYASLM